MTQRSITNALIIAVALGCKLSFIAPVAAEEIPSPDGVQAAPAEEMQQEQPGEQTFTIRRFVIEGTNLFTAEELQQQLRQFVGRKKTAADVERARDTLEIFFHDQGYPTVMVNIPEQSVQNRVIRLEVIENRVGKVTLTGNSWYTSEKILADLPSIAPGKVIKLQDLQQEVNRLNRNPDLKVIPEMQPGTEPGTVDLSLQVTDKQPLHGALELNNRSSHDTTESRLTGSLRYDNLWQRDHTLSFLYQTSPEKLSEVQVASASYTMPAPWDRENKIVLYGVWSNSQTTTTGAFQTVGKGIIIGSRLIVPLPAVGDYSQTLSLGLDYKDFEETNGMGGAESTTPISYLPASAAYNGLLRDDSGTTAFNAAVNVSFRGLVSEESKFENKRYKARSNYIFMTAGAERNQKLPWDFTLLARLDGQIADQPLISNEQYIAGGVESVRGYRESEASGDQGVHGVVELAAADLLGKSGKEGYRLTPYLFYDYAQVWLKEPLPGQTDDINLQGAGIGLRGLLFNAIDYQTDLGFALRDTSQTTAGDVRLHFRLRYQF